MDSDTNVESQPTATTRTFTPESGETAPLEPGDLLLEMVMALVDNPGDVSIQERRNGHRVQFMVTTAPGDAGKVIGKEGTALKSVQEVLRRTGDMRGYTVEIRVVSPKDRRART